MHPNNTKRGSNINMKNTKRDKVNVEMDLTALPTIEAFKAVPELQRIGFYMMVWMAEQELRPALKMTNVDAPDYDALEDKQYTLREWMRSVEEALPLWFATRYLR